MTPLFSLNGSVSPEVTLFVGPVQLGVRGTGPAQWGPRVTPRFTWEPAPGVPNLCLVTLVTSPPRSQLLSCALSLAIVQGGLRVPLNQRGLECDVAASGRDAEPLPRHVDGPAHPCPFGERPEHPWAVGPEPSELGGGMWAAGGQTTACWGSAEHGLVLRGVSTACSPWMSTAQ